MCGPLQWQIIRMLRLCGGRTQVLPDGAIDLRLHIDGEVPEEQEVAPIGH